MNKGSFTGQISMIKEISAGKPVVKVTLIQYNGQPILTDISKHPQNLIFHIPLRK